VRYEALWLFVALGLLLEAGFVLVLWWTLFLPVLSICLLAAYLATAKDRRWKHAVGVASEATSAVIALLYILLFLAAAYSALQSADPGFLGPPVRGIAAYARLGLGVLALLGAIFFYGTAHGIEEARTLPTVVRNPRFPHTVSGYRALLGTMLGLFLSMAALAITFAIMLELTLLLAYLQDAFTPVLLQFTVDKVIYYGAIVVGFALSIAGLAATAQALRGAREVGGDQVGVLAAALVLWAMSLLIHTITAFLPTVSGAFVAVLALAATARTLSNFYPLKIRLRIWFTALLLSGIQFPAHAVATAGPSVCPRLLAEPVGQDACVLLLGQTGSLVAVLGGALFGYLFADYYSLILKALKATRAPAPQKTTRSVPNLTMSRAPFAVPDIPPPPDHVPEPPSQRERTVDEVLLPPPP